MTWYVLVGVVVTLAVGVAEIRAEHAFLCESTLVHHTERRRVVRTAIGGWA
jgi:hypothetical protein